MLEVEREMSESKKFTRPISRSFFLLCAAIFAWLRCATPYKGFPLPSGLGAAVNIGHAVLFGWQIDSGFLTNRICDFSFAFDY